MAANIRGLREFNGAISLELRLRDPVLSEGLIHRERIGKGGLSARVINVSPQSTSLWTISFLHFPWGTRYSRASVSGGSSPVRQHRALR
jgi:hypothetical protein